MSQVEQKMEIYGLNELQEKKKISPWFILLQQFISPLIIILLFATLVSIVIGDTA